MQDTIWNEKIPGQFERPLDSVQLFYRDIGKRGETSTREHWAVRAYAKFRYNYSPAATETALKHAWRSLRYLQPQMAAYLQGNRMIYHAPQSATLESWMAETFLVETVLTVDELLASPRPSSLPTLHYVPKTSEVLFCASQWRIDAIGATSLMNLLFKLVAEPLHASFIDESRNLSQGRDEAARLPRDISQEEDDAATSLLMEYAPFMDESRNLSPGRDEAARLPRDISQEVDDAATSLLMEYATNLPSLGLPVELVNEVSGAIRRTETRFSPATTTSVISACKTKDLTVTTAVHAAMILALQELSSGESLGERYTSWGTFNYRPYLDPIYADPAIYPVAAMLCSLPITFPTSASFHETASALKPFYAQLQNPFRCAALHVILAPYTEKCAAMINQPLPPRIPQPTEPLVDSVGIMDRYLQGEYGEGAVEVTDFWLGSVVLTRQPLFYVWTWRGKMTLSMCYNEQFYTARFMRSFVERVARILFRELAVEHQ